MIRIQRKIIRLGRDLIKCPVGRTKHFSFICRRNDIISFGWNNAKKTHPLARRFNYYDSTTHSELAAILSFPYPISELSRFDFYNIRLSPKDKSIMISKPCECCQELLGYFGVDRVHFTTNRGFEEFII